MQIVIEIDEKAYEQIKRIELGSGLWPTTLALYNSVQNGTPLPKGHGKLKDFDKIEWYGCTTKLDCPYKDRECKDCHRAECSKTQVDGIPTIIEADKEG